MYSDPAEAVRDAQVWGINGWLSKIMVPFLDPYNTAPNI